MGGCCKDKVDNILVPTDQEAWCKFQSVARWKQWGVNAEDSFGSVDNGNNAAGADEVSCETLMDEYEMDCQDDESEISGVQGGDILESLNCWTTFSKNQDEFPRTYQTDANFVNTMFLDDERVGEQYQSTYLTANNLHEIERSYELYKTPEPLNLFDWDKESDVSHQNPSNSINNDVYQYTAPLWNAESFLSVEETVLQDFGKAMFKMTDNTRLCFRDALYRLATNSGKHSSIQGQQGDDCASEKPSSAPLIDQSLRPADKHAAESRTKAIDITIADLLFNKAYQQYDDCHKGLSSTPQSRCNALISADTEVPILG